jgi:hypothetical protein
MDLGSAARCGSDAPPLLTDGSAWVATRNYVRLAWRREPAIHAPRVRGRIVILERRGTVDGPSVRRTFEIPGGDVINVPANVRRAVRVNSGPAVVSVGDLDLSRACGPPRHLRGEVTGPFTSMRALHKTPRKEEAGLEEGCGGLARHPVVRTR